MILFSESQLAKHSEPAGQAYSAEASTLGWRAGFYAQEFKIEGIEEIFTFADMDTHEGDVTAFRYSAGPGLRATIWND